MCIHITEGNGRHRRQHLPRLLLLLQPPPNHASMSAPCIAPQHPPCSKRSTASATPSRHLPTKPSQPRHLLFRPSPNQTRHSVLNTPRPSPQLAPLPPSSRRLPFVELPPPVVCPPPLTHPPLNRALAALFLACPQRTHVSVGHRTAEDLEASLGQRVLGKAQHLQPDQCTRHALRVRGSHIACLQAHALSTCASSVCACQVGQVRFERRVCFQACHVCHGCVWHVALVTCVCVSNQALTCS